MPRVGLLTMLELGLGMSMAGPMAVVGVEFLRTGRPAAGVGFLGLAAFALFFPSYLVRRIGGPRTWVRRRLGRTGPTEDEAEASSTPLKRILRR